MADMCNRRVLLRLILFVILVVRDTACHSPLDQLAESFGNFLGSLGGGDDCQYTCSDGSKPKKRPNHSPSSNGCGALGLQLDTSSTPDMTDCCDQHDHCYDTCNTDRDICDLDFKECLEELCKKRKKKLSKSEYKNCVGTMNLMYAGTMALGCKSYKEAQSKACYCPRRNNEL